MLYNNMKSVEVAFTGVARIGTLTGKMSFSVDSTDVDFHVDFHVDCQYDRQKAVDSAVHTTVQTSEVS